jgi:hypothetical protein
MCLIKGAFVGEKNLDVIKMHGTITKKNNHMDLVYYSFITRYNISGLSTSAIIR